MKSEPPAGWRPATLGELVTLQRGFDLPSADRRDGDVPVVSSAGISGSHDEARVESPVVVVGRYGTLGQVFVLERPCWPLNTTLWSKDLHGNDYRYVAAVLSNIDYDSLQDKTSVPGVNRNHLHALPLAIPPLPEQRRVAWLLSTLDEKIAAARAAAQTAHALVEAQYGLLVAKADGLVERSVADLADRLHKSVEPKTSADTLFEHFSIPAYDATGLPDVCLGASMLSAKNDITGSRCVLFSKLNPQQKRIWWIEPHDGMTRVASPEFVALTEKVPGGLSLVWAALGADEQVRGRLIGRATGTTGSRQRVKHSDVLAVKLLAPNDARLVEWGRSAEALLRFADRSMQEVGTISALRLVLLPKLVTGEIRVPDTTDIREAVGAMTTELSENGSVPETVTTAAA